MKENNSDLEYYFIKSLERAFLFLVNDYIEIKVQLIELL